MTETMAIKALAKSVGMPSVVKKEVVPSINPLNFVDNPLAALKEE